MNFTLFYAGHIPSGNKSKSDRNKSPDGDKSKVERINDIRLALSPQIRRIYECEPLKSHKVICEPGGDSEGYLTTYTEVEGRSYSALANPSIQTVCQLEITYFEAEGDLTVKSQIHDVDNKTKSLVDALCMPLKSIVKDKQIDLSNETVHCLLSDDKLIWGIDIKRRRLLDKELGKGKTEEGEVGKGKTFTQIDVKIMPKVVSFDTVGLFGVPVF